MPISANSFSILVPEFLKVKNCGGWKRENSAKISLRQCKNGGKYGKSGKKRRLEKRKKKVENSNCGGAPDTGKNQIKAGKITI